MAAQWHYSKGGERHGPVSSDQLRQLASSGQLGPTDLVWRDGMAEWQKASAVKGLFPSQTSVPTESPPIPQSQPQHVADPVSPTAAPTAGQSEKHGLLGTLSEIGHAARTAAVVAAKEAERTKINNVDLPKAYAALGRDVHGRGAHRQDFAEIYRQIDDLLARLRNLEGDSSNQPNPPATFADKAKAAAVATKQKAEAQAVRLQLARLMSKLGEAVYERHGNAAGSPGTTEPIASLRSRASTLGAEVEQHRQASGGRFITRKRVVVAVVVTAIGIALLLPAIESARDASRKDKTATNGSEAMTGDKSQSDISGSDLRLSRELKDRAAQSDFAAYFTNGTSARAFSVGGKAEPNDFSPSPQAYLALQTGDTGCLVELNEVGNPISEIQLEVKQRYEEDAERHEYTAMVLGGMRVVRNSGKNMETKEYKVVAYNHKTHHGQSRVDIITARIQEDEYGRTSRDEEFYRWRGDGVFLKHLAQESAREAGYKREETATASALQSNVKRGNGSEGSNVQSGDPSVEFDRLDFGAVDLSRGPQGQPVEVKKELDGQIVSRGYTGRDGKWYQHGRQLMYDLAGRLGMDDSFVYGRQHGTSLHYDDFPTIETAFTNGRIVKRIVWYDRNRTRKTEEETFSKDGKQLSHYVWEQDGTLLMRSENGKIIQ